MSSLSNIKIPAPILEHLQGFLQAQSLWKGTIGHANISGDIIWGEIIPADKIIINLSFNNDGEYFEKNYDVVEFKHKMYHVIYKDDNGELRNEIIKDWIFDAIKENIELGFTHEKIYFSEEIDVNEILLHWKSDSDATEEFTMLCYIHELKDVDMGYPYQIYYPNFKMSVMSLRRVIQKIIKRGNTPPTEGL